MGEISVDIHVTITVADANGTAFDVVKTWVKTNIKDKLPSGADMIESYVVRP